MNQCFFKGELIDSPHCICPTVRHALGLLQSESGQHHVNKLGATALALALASRESESHEANGQRLSHLWRRID